MTETAGHVYIVDDDAGMRDSLVLLLETAGYRATAFAQGEDFLAACNPACEGCAILDINMPSMSGLALQEAMLQRHINLPVIFLTAYGTIPDAVTAMRHGATDFLTKPVDGKLLLQCVEDALTRGHEAGRRAQEARSVAARLGQLTQRELEIARLIAAGRSSKEIGNILSISHRTVEVHRWRLMKKLDTANQVELARLVFESENTQE